VLVAGPHPGPFAASQNNGDEWPFHNRLSELRVGPAHDVIQLADHVSRQRLF